MKTFVEALRPFVQNKSRVSVIDLHTGLGPLFGEVLYHCEGSTDISMAMFDGKVELPGQNPQSYRGQGLIADRLTKEFPHVQWQCLVQEFGVKSTTESFLALLLENQYHWKNFGKIPDALYLKHPIKGLLYNTFFCSQELWIDWIRNKGVQRFTELLHFEEDQLK
jgi:hypothetical protein